MSKKSKLFSILGVTILAVTLLLLQVNRTRQRQKTLVIGIYTDSSWDVPNGQQYHMIDYAIKKFKQKYPDIKVTYENGIRRDDYGNWLSQKIVKNNVPDLVIVPNNDFNLLASEGAFKSLDSMMTFADIKRSAFYSCTLKAGQYAGQQFALPYEANPTLMVINKTLLKKTGLKVPGSNWTPQNFYQKCHQINHLNAKKHYFGVTSNYTWQDAQLAYNNQIFTGNDNKLQLTSTKARQAFTLSENLINDSNSRNVTSQLFDKGRVAFMPLSLAQYRTYTSYPYHVTRNNSFLWQCTKMPGIKAAKATPISTSLFAISSKAKNTPAAWQFMRLLCTNRDVQTELMKTNIASSVLPSVVKAPKMQKILDDKVIDHHNLTTHQLDIIMKNGAVTPKFKDYNDKLAALDYRIQTALSAGNLETHLFTIQSQVNQK